MAAAAPAKTITTVTETIPAAVTPPTPVFPEVVTPPVILSDQWATFLHFISWPIATLVAVFLVSAIIVWSVQKSRNKLDFKDLILDVDNGRVSLAKFSNLVALCVSSWGLIALVVGGVLTEWYFTAYMIAWAGNGVLTQWIKTRGEDPESGRRHQRSDDYASRSLNPESESPSLIAAAVK